MVRTWFITGVNSGFGREMAVQLLGRGERVAGTTRRPDDIADLKAKYGTSFWTAQLDLTDTAAVADVVNRAFHGLGRIDVVVNNAGYGQFGAVEGLSDEQIARQIDTNLIGPIHVVRAALPHLRRQGGGRLIAMSSYGGQATHPGASLYHASKWGLEGFFDSVAAEVAPLGIGVTIVEPGAARTAFRTTAGTLLGADVDAYRNTSIGAMRAMLSNPGAVAKGDPGKMVQIIIDSVEMDPGPRRIALGGDAYTMIKQALVERLAALEAQKDAAFSTDVAR
ncbi:NADP-dependent 3-hydroxy acid dehydrogenase YdfG [Methylobacterium sp. 275MFSha3.1]|uniref:SDR family oxidoreductase n=1 Tax=Methylobacterium sp. 275MFSha3.1 TaxID=1502746 RepID=UPI0008A7EA1F|nr:SDR family oxidoreductase [Methylobacterium sp. 275MFSha3.1]SEI11761.1 NADP-dependent 3-hydroxy acid dehydrogenase YdfG [Methylobacterium sp. 275MFSha3.1]